jgi:hypothetical protein
VRAEVGSFHIGNIISATNDVELQLHHAGEFRSSVKAPKTSVIFKEPECLLEFSSLHVSLGIGSSALSADFSQSDILDHLIDNGGLGWISHIVLHNPVLLVGHEVRDSFLGHGECGAPAVSRMVFWSRCFSTIGHYIEMSCNVVWPDLQETISFEVHGVGVLLIVNKGHKPTEIRPVCGHQWPTDSRHGGAIELVHS